MALKGGEPLPDVIELDSPADLDRVLAKRDHTRSGVSGSGRDSIGKTSLRAAAKVGMQPLASADVLWHELLFFPQEWPARLHMLQYLHASVAT